jgi:hypothetical protein
VYDGALTITTDQLLQAMTLIGQVAGPFAATVAAIAGVIGTLRSQRNTRTIHEIKVNVDGRLTQLLEMTKAAAHAQGVLAEKTRQETDKIDNSDTPAATAPTPAIPLPATDLPRAPF